MFPHESTVIMFPPFRLEVLSEQLWHEGKTIPLRAKTFAILRYLAEHPGRLVSKAELLRAIWGETQVSEDGLRDYIQEIRRALNDTAQAARFVETVRGRGYRFIAALPTTSPAVPSFTFQAPSQEEVIGSQYPVVRRSEEGEAGGQAKNRLTPQRPTSPSLLAIRGVYDGKELRVLPTELLPIVQRETSVLIVFLDQE